MYKEQKEKLQQLAKRIRKETGKSIRLNGIGKTKDPIVAIRLENVSVLCHVDNHKFQNKTHGSHFYYNQMETLRAFLTEYAKEFKQEIILVHSKSSFDDIEGEDLLHTYVSSRWTLPFGKRKERKEFFENMTKEIASHMQDAIYENMYRSRGTTDQFFFNIQTKFQKTNVCIAATYKGNEILYVLEIENEKRVVQIEEIYSIVLSTLEQKEKQGRFHTLYEENYLHTIEMLDRMRIDVHYKSQNFMDFIAKLKKTYTYQGIEKESFRKMNENDMYKQNGKFTAFSFGGYYILYVLNKKFHVFETKEERDRVVQQIALEEIMHKQKEKAENMLKEMGEYYEVQGK